ncbi:MAG: hypothetical protein F4109_09075 [Gammaproteobacteria bacterium]|nr:hypothetical protein [Gammaproteobacteria bacterium]MYD02943.1 hypothetical protein [Gammaproteobacteria bacterium]MYI25566.1 hypothetical protein [Gammaproteobacteria bacterium]
MNPTVLLLAVYCPAIFVAAILGGRLSVLGALTHTRTQVIMSLVAGFILGIALFHLLPHGMELMPGLEKIEHGMLWTALGIIFMVALQRIFRFHQHDFSSEAQALQESQGPSHAAVGARSVAGIAFGLTVHTITEGIALGASMQERVHATAIAAMPGLGVFLAILLHKPLDAYSILSVMRSAGYERGTCNIVNIAFALLCPLVALGVFWLGTQLAPAGGGELAGYALCFAAGVFLCVALSDVLPEIHFHTHDRFKLIIVFLVGIGLAYALHFVEAGALHDHSHGHSHRH